MPTLFRWCLFTALLLLPASVVSAQVDATIVGTITDVDTGEALPTVNVFIASSMNGMTTDNQGRYRLRGIPLGALRLYVSMIGFEPQSRDIFIREAKTYTFDFQLKEAIYEIGEITITADNKKWKRQLEKFTRLFIGETPYALETKIVNPEVMDFSSKRGEFRGQASEPLIIENKALGYRITYFLKEFVSTPTRWRYDGEPLYEEMTAESPEQRALWNARRDSAFYGSFRHFLLALVNDKVEEQGFKTYSRPARQSLGGQAAMSDQRYPIEASKILKDSEIPGEKILDFEGFVEVIYTRETEDKTYLRLQNQPYRRPKFQTSPIKLENGPAIIDLKGDMLDPYGVTFYGGYFGYERMANEMPKEYRPWLK